MWSGALGAVLLGEELAALAGAVGVAGQREDLGVVDEAVDHGCGHDVAAEDLAPALGVVDTADRVVATDWRR